MARHDYTKLQMIALLKGTTAFQDVPENLLKKIAEKSKHVSYKTGDFMYDVGDIAYDIYVMITGRVELMFSSSEKAKVLIRPLLGGAVFGWAALYRSKTRKPITRLARATCREPTEVMAINTDDLARLFKSDKTAYDHVMRQVRMMVDREYSIPRDWKGFAD